MPYKQGCKFSDFSLISDFLTLTSLKIISLNFIIFSNFRLILSYFQIFTKSLCIISDFFIEPRLDPCI